MESGQPRTAITMTQSMLWKREFISALVPEGQCRMLGGLPEQDAARWRLQLTWEAERVNWKPEKLYTLEVRQTPTPASPTLQGVLKPPPKEIFIRGSCV